MAVHCVKNKTELLFNLTNYSTKRFPVSHHLYKYNIKRVPISYFYMRINITYGRRAIIRHTSCSASYVPSASLMDCVIIFDIIIIRCTPIIKYISWAYCTQWINPFRFFFSYIFLLSIAKTENNFLNVKSRLGIGLHQLLNVRTAYN